MHNIKRCVLSLAYSAHSIYIQPLVTMVCQHGNFPFGETQKQSVLAVLHGKIMSGFIVPVQNRAVHNCFRFLFDDTRLNEARNIFFLLIYSVKWLQLFEVAHERIQSFSWAKSLYCVFNSRACMCLWDYHRTQIIDQNAFCCYRFFTTQNELVQVMRHACMHELWGRGELQFQQQIFTLSLKWRCQNDTQNRKFI